MYESSGSHFFRSTNGVLSGSYVFGESRLVMSFLTNLGVREISCSLRLVLPGKAVREIPQSSRVEF